MPWVVSEPPQHYISFSFLPAATLLNPSLHA